MKNHFKIISGGREFSYCNTLRSAFEHWKNGEAYAAYMAVTGDETVYKKAELIAYNDNVSAGELFATYRVSLSESECPAGITSVGFAPYIGGELSNSCSVNIPKGEAILFGTVYLDPMQANTALYPAANPLIRSLLGMEKRPEISLVGGKDVMDNLPMLVEISEYSPVSCSVTDDGCEISFETENNVDFVVLCGGKPCLRFNLGYADKTVETEVHTSKYGGFFLPEALGLKGEKFNCYPLVGALRDANKPIYEQFADFELISDPLNRYVGLLNGSTLYLGDENFELTHKGSYIGKIMLCSDGSVATYNFGKVTFEDLGKSVNVAVGETEVLYREGGYDIFVYSDGKMYIYRYDGELSLAHEIQIGSGERKLYRANDFSVLLSDSKTAMRAFSYRGETEPYETSGLTSEKVHDGCYYGNGYMGSIFSGKRVNCDNAYGRFFNEGDKLFYLGESGAAEVGNFKISGAAIAGEAVYLLVSGKIKCMRMAISGIFVSTDSAERISCDVYRASKANKKIRLKTERI